MIKKLSKNDLQCSPEHPQGDLQSIPKVSLYNTTVTQEYPKKDTREIPRWIPRYLNSELTLSLRLQTTISTELSHIDQPTVRIEAQCQKESMTWQNIIPGLGLRFSLSTAINRCQQLLIAYVNCVQNFCLSCFLLPAVDSWWKLLKGANFYVAFYCPQLIKALTNKLSWAEPNPV